MKFKCCFILGSLLISASAYADLPHPDENAKGELVTAQKLIMSNTELTELKERLKTAVFSVYAKQESMHALAQNGALFDGAAVAVPTEAVKDIIKNGDVTEEQAEEAKKSQSHSFFDRGLENSSSHFQRQADADSTWKSSRQYYLTTADWLTRTERLEIDIFGERVEARIEYRDDAQNVAVLSSKAHGRIKPAALYDPEDPVPSVVYALLSPGTMYENLTQHIMNVPQAHLYGITNLMARNGYPVFTSEGQLTGLLVGPDASRKKAFVVHSGLLDRALHPAKYDRTKVEEIKLTEY